MLVVDDELDLRFLVRLALESRGHEVIEAADGEDALERLAEAAELPQVIVTDLHMPAMDGRELVARLRSDASTSSIPIVLWSARPDQELPVDQVITKGRFVDVVDAIESLMERAQWND